MKNSNNKILVVILLVLAAAFVLTRVFRTPALETNLDLDIFRIDTAGVAAIKFRKPGGEHELTLMKKNTGWIVQQDSRSAAVEPYQIRALLQTLSNVKPGRMVSRKKEKWNDYRVEDSTALMVTTLDEDAGKLAAWAVGKENAGVTYVRPADETEVYAVEENLRSRFDKTFNDWRDKTFLRVGRDAMDRITFTYPADSGFVLEKKSGAWMIGQEKADSAKVQRYLGRLQSRDLSGFADNFSPGGDPDVVLSIDGSTLHTEVKGWKGSGKKWILSSTAQEGVYFSDSTFVEDLFVGKKVLTGK